jgi:hypothetical protein
MNFNFGKMLGKLLSRKRHDITAHAKAPVIAQAEPMKVDVQKISDNGNGVNHCSGLTPRISRIRRRMAAHSRKLNSARARGKHFV